MAGTQFIGKEPVLMGYDNAGIDTWAIFQQKRLIVTGSDRGALENWLDSFLPAGSRAGYTLRMYRDMEHENVRPSTEYSASFDFVLQDPVYGGSVGANGGYREIITRLDRLEKGGGSDSDFDLNAIVMGWLKKPAELEIVAGIIKGFFFKQPTQVAAMGSTIPTQMSDEQRLNRLMAVLDRLEKADPEILIHLEQLANVAETKPDTFKFLLKSLNGL